MLNRQCASATANMGVEQADRGIELKERQREHSRRRHAVGQQPEEQVLVAQEPVARERIGRRQRHRDRDDGVHHHIDDRVDVAPIPGWIGEDRDRHSCAASVACGKSEKPPRISFRLEAHIDEPVDRQHQEDDVEDGEKLRPVECARCSLFSSLRPSACASLLVITV